MRSLDRSLLELASRIEATGNFQEQDAQQSVQRSVRFRSRLELCFRIQTAFSSGRGRALAEVQRCDSLDRWLRELACRIDATGNSGRVYFLAEHSEVRSLARK